MKTLTYLEGDGVPVFRYFYSCFLTCYMFEKRILQYLSYIHTFGHSSLAIERYYVH